MNPNGAIAAKPAPKMINDVVPPYASALPSFARPAAQPEQQAQPVVQAAPQPEVQAQPAYTPAPVAVAPAPAPVAEAAPSSTVTPMFPTVSPVAPAAPAVSPMFEAPAQPMTPAPVAEVPVHSPMVDQNLSAPIIAQPILPNAPAQPAKKSSTNWLAIAIAVLVAAGLGAAAYLAFKQAG